MTVLRAEHQRVDGTMIAKRESEALASALLPFAEKMLTQYGEFFPYGGYMKLDGEIVLAGAKDPDIDRPNSNDLVNSLRDSFKEIAPIKRYKAVAIVFNVAVRLPGSNRNSNAIQICADHIDGYSVEVFFPYQLISGQLVYAESFAQEGRHEIFRC